MEGLLQTIINFFRAIWDAFLRLFEWLGDAYDALIDFFKDLPEWVFSKLVDAVVEFFNSLPVPDFMANVSNTFNVIPPVIVYFAQPFNIGYGVTVVLGAYLLRFIVRRIPIIG